MKLMARPIEPTPPITGEDADRLAEQLEKVPPPEELARRIEEAKRFLEQVTAPKFPRPLRVPGTSR
jgi:hypothetical protein